MKRKIISILMAMVILLTMVDVSVFASEATLSENEVQNMVEEVVDDAEGDEEEETTVSENEAGQEQKENSDMEKMEVERDAEEEKDLIVDEEAKLEEQKNFVENSNIEMNTEATKEEVYVGDFNLYTFRADMYLEEDSVCNRTIQFMKDMTMPSQLIVEQLDSKNTFQKKVTAWKHAHYVTSPSEIAEGGMDEIGYYTAVILSVFKAQTDNTSFIYDCAKEVNSNTNKILSNTKKWVEETENIDLKKIKKNQILSAISVEEQKAIRDILTKEFKENHPVLSKSSTISSDLAAIFGAVDTLGEAVELMESYIQMTEVSEGMKNVLMEMYEQCPDSNGTLKTALYNASLSTEGLSGAIDATILNTVDKGASDVLGVLMDEGWETAIKAIPYAKTFMTGAEVGTWLGDTICNTLFSTDKTIEQYQKMKCLHEFTELLGTVIANIEITYLNNKTTENAENYFAAVDALFSVIDLSCKFAEDYAKILYEDATIGWMVINKQDYSEYMKAVRLMKGDFEDYRDSLMLNYFNELKYNYSDIYTILMGLDGDNPIFVSGISFDKDEIVIGLEDLYIHHVGGITIVPFNANNQCVTYSSSDSSIVSVDEKKGLLTALRSGIAYITVTTEDGRYTDTICVKVVEGKSGKYEAIECSRVAEYGMCGENAEWIFYDSGLLVIDGSGEMENYYYSSFGFLPWDNYLDEIVEVKIGKDITHIGDYAFYECKNLKSIELSENLVSIGMDSFYLCSSLKSVIIPDKVTSIGMYSFSECSDLNKVEIPSGVTNIGMYAFSGCDNLKEIEIPNGIKSIEMGMFLGCSSLESIVIPDGVESIGMRAFLGCSNLRSVEISEGITSIGVYAFRNCSSLTNVKLPKGITSIEDYTFANCSNLRRVEIPEGVTSIGAYAFYYCSSLSGVEIPEGVTRISEDAFCGCSNLEEVRIPDTINYMGDSVFAVCSRLSSVIISNGLTSIGSYMFSGCSSLRRVEIPEGVTNIGSRVFNNCISLESIVIGKNVMSIGGVVFEGCSSDLIIYGIKGSYVETYAKKNNIQFAEVTSQKFVIDENGVLVDYLGTDMEVEIPENITGIQNNVFEDHTEITSIILPDSITTIGEEAFSGCTNLITINIPSNMKTIPSHAFSGCESLENMILPSSVRSIENEAFKGCSSLELIVIPEGETRIAVDAFLDCEYLNICSIKGSSVENYANSNNIKFLELVSQKFAVDENGVLVKYIGTDVVVAIPDSVTAIQYYAFKNCITVTKVIIPNSVISMGGGVFEGCKNLKTINIPKNLKSIPSRTFIGCSSLESIEIPYGVESIGSTAFRNCDSLTKVVIPESVTSIGVYAFFHCEMLENITIPDSVTSIGNNAFSACFSLKEVKVGKGITAIPGRLFAGCSQLEIVMLPHTVKTIDNSAFVDCTSTKLSIYSIEGTYAEIFARENNIKFIAIQNSIWSAGITDKIYTGSNINQSFRVYDSTKLLKEKIDYTISYKNNKNAYTYLDEDYTAFEENLKNTGKKVKTGTFDPAKAPQVTIKMKGNYSGSKTIYFKIEQADISGEGFETADLTVTYTGKKQTTQPTLTWNGNKLKYGTDFYVPEYDNAKNDKKAFTEPQREPYKLTIVGKKNFTGEIPITLTISNSTKQIAMNKVTVKGITNKKWNGEQITQSGFKVSYGKDVLTEENGDYTISWGANKAVGTGTVTFTGTGQDTDGDGFSYIGSKTVSFKITGTAMSKVTVTGVEKSYPFTGTAIKPIASLSYKANKNVEPIPLAEGTHYTVDYQKNVDKGTATIVFTGLESGGYTGTKRQTFKITAAGVSDIANGDVVTEQIQVAFKDVENVQDGIYIAPHMKGGAKPEVIVTSGSRTLKPNIDYTISYANNKKTALSTDKNAPSLTVKGKGNFTGSKKIYFTIAPKALTNENGIKVVVNDKIVSNKPNGYRQNFKVYDSDGKVLGSADYDAGKAVYTLIETQNEDGTVKEENRILDKKSIVPANSTICITVLGKGNYAGGEVYATYRILENSHDISKATIQIENQDYTGNPVLITEQNQFKTGKVYIKIGKENKELILGEDIQVVPGSYVKHVDKGTAKVTFRGINDFGGTKTVSYKIGARSIEKFWKGIQARMARMFD